ncbi:MAG: N-6 DNA methylase [Pyrinomonadaceae bacterium]
MRTAHGHQLNTMFGVGLDGNYFIFIRFRDDKWHVQEPVEVNKYSAERFLWALYNLGQKGKPFSSEYLAGDFGSDSKLAQDGVRALYNAIIATDNPKAQIFFSQWKILFGEVCGYDVDNPSDKIKKLAEFYGVEHRKNFKAAELLFAVHSYYAIFMKLLASEIAAYFHKLPTPLQKMIQASSRNALKREMEDLEAGSIFRHLNITNFLEGDLFAWYIPVWSEPIEQLVRGMVARLDDYNPGTLSEDPAGSRDLLKKLYQQLFPKSVRHDLGEYYTPDWLAEHVLNELEYVGDPDKRLLDPACGSGTFLVMAINRIRKWYDENRERARFDEGDLCRKILSNVVGFDLNPLAVMAARTNYLIAIRDLVGHVDNVEIPVYLCDSIMTPSEHGGLFAGALGKAKELKTAAARFIIPTEIASHRDEVAKYAEQLEFGVRNGYSPEEFVQRCRDEGLTVSEEDLHTDLYAELVRLDRENKNGVWARIIKNSFAPIFVGKVDYVAGNPPWINWESLPGDYRQATAPLWQKYDLFRHKGYKAKLGGGKDDISILFTYVAHDCYLDEGGRLGFVITQTVFKTKGGGEGFRTLQYQSDGKTYYLTPLSVDDFSDFQPFEGATNRTAVIVVGKSTKKFTYPVPYLVWKKHQKQRVSQDTSLEEIVSRTSRKTFAAAPIVPDIPTSPWLTVPSEALSAVKKVLGQSAYDAKAGTCTWLNGVYWIRILEVLNDGNLLVENLHNVGRIEVSHVRTAIEPDLVYPLLRGRDVLRWRGEPSAHIILPNRTDKLAGIAESEMKLQYPKTFAYLKSFEPQLKKRSGFRQYFKPTAPFYSIYNVGPYTLAPYKVVWREQSKEFQAANLGSVGGKPIVPDHKLMEVACYAEDEADYLTGLLGSSPCKLLVMSYVISTSTSTHVLEHLAVPKYDPKKDLHIELADLAKRCKMAAVRGEDVSGVEGELDVLAARLWGIAETELRWIQTAWTELKSERD